jgi:hypothetical protein
MKLNELLVYLISIIIITTILSTKVFGEAIENCCDGLDNDGDGRIDAADSDCQLKSFTLVSGRNSVCWSTPVPYPDNFRTATGYYTCPSGQIVTAIELTVNTEAGYDVLLITDDRGNEIARRSGTLGDITVNVSDKNAAGVSFTFTSDGSVVPSGGVARVRAITCASPTTAPTECPAGTIPTGVSECRGYGGTCVASHELGCCCRLPTTGAENCCDGVDVTLNK